MRPLSVPPTRDLTALTAVPAADRTPPAAPAPRMPPDAPCTAGASRATSLSVLVGGAAGQGVDVVGSCLARIASSLGLEVLAAFDSPGQVRGGHAFATVHVRAGRRPRSHVGAHGLLLALAAETLALHLESVAPDGLVIRDERIDEVPATAGGDASVSVPMCEIARDAGLPPGSLGGAALGAAAAALGYPLIAAEESLRTELEAADGALVERHVAAMRRSWWEARRRCGAGAARINGPATPHGERILVRGNHALAFGALAAGCSVVPTYPMTPSTSIFEWLAGLDPALGVVAVQTEDELAAAAMAAGAGFAGARAMTVTSGGGLSLMAETIGYAGMTEIPLVVVDAQRAGPATGMPTRTEQSDLRFAVNIGHGESPRIVLAPGSVEECFEVAWRAFNLAEQYQCPVIILTDAHLATTMVSLPADALDADAVAIERGPTLRAGRTPPAAAEPFERFATTADGVSPRAFPGDPLAVHSVTGDEHDASGHINHDEDVRVAMVEKRARKMAAAARALRPPQLHGSADAATTLVSWGSTSMACREAVDAAAQHGLSVSFLQFGDLWPFPLEAEAMLRRCHRLVLVEQNASGQLGELIRQVTGISIEERLLDSSGRPITPEAVLDRVRDEVVVDLATWRRAA